MLSGLVNALVRSGVSDAHCGMRALRLEVIPRLDLRTTGMEFASEMVIRAAKESLEIREFPIEYHPPRRVSPSCPPCATDSGTCDTRVGRHRSAHTDSGRAAGDSGDAARGPRVCANAYASLLHE